MLHLKCYISVFLSVLVHVRSTPNTVKDVNKDPPAVSQTINAPMRNIHNSDHFLTSRKSITRRKSRADHLKDKFSLGDMQNNYTETLKRYRGLQAAIKTYTCVLFA